MGALVEKCCKCSAGCQRDRQPCVKPGGLVSASLLLSCTPVILGLNKHLDCQICDTPEDVNETRTCMCVRVCVCVCVCVCVHALILIVYVASFPLYLTAHMVIVIPTK